MPRKRPLQKLPAPTSAPRVETGAVQFGEDWPGVFIRGDDASRIAGAIKTLCRTGTMDGIGFIALTDLMELIERDAIVPRKKRRPYEIAKDRPNG